MTKARYLWFGLAVISMVFLMGCGGFWGAFGRGVTGGGSDGSTGGVAGGTVGLILGTLVPWAGAALGLLGTAAEDIKRRKYLKVANVLVSGISKAKSEGANTGRLVEILADEQNKAGVREEVRKLKHLAEGKVGNGG